MRSCFFLAAAALSILAGCGSQVVDGTGQNRSDVGLSGGSGGSSGSSVVATADVVTATTGSSGDSVTTGGDPTTTGGGIGVACSGGARLVGINALGAGTPAQIARLDPATGALTVLSTLDVDGGFSIGFSAYDAATNHLYELGDSLYTIDATSGAVLAEVSYDALDVYNPETNAAGDLFVVHLSTASVAKLDPSTGALTDLAALPTTSFAQGMSASDKTADRIYQFGDAEVITVDGASGAVLSVVALSDASFVNPEVDAAGALLGVHYAGSGSSVARLDPTTGVITDLAPIDAGFADGIKAYDPVCDVVYQPSGFDLYAISPSGAVSWTTPMAQQNFMNFEAVQ